MEKQLIDLFQKLWQKYFDNAELPIVYWYSDEVTAEEVADSKVEERCLIGNLNRVRQGHTFIYDRHTSGCAGGKRYSGFSHTLRPKFEYFLSCGIEGELEGERYKKSPELVEEMLKRQPPFDAPGKFLVFKRFDRLSEADHPWAVIFFATADVLAGLFTLANFDYADRQAVITPMGAGCASIITYPLEEMNQEKPRCVLGMFDVSARPNVSPGELTFTIPWKRFCQMVDNMDESFLITESWNKVRQRMSEKPG